MTTSTYTVVGMTCEHCVRSVSEEVGAIPGVSDLSVDLATGSLSVTTDAEVAEALEEAGAYALV